ncbi:hypothetical protein GCM10008986_34610 [Salinibacillus aidingensis]|uniref:Uncharacterized protein n=1 Tax=Salinibacillus aidingensis TaxID=237684 RepID=A0ABN1BRL4_9BACI
MVFKGFGASHSVFRYHLASIAEAHSTFGDRPAFLDAKGAYLPLNSFLDGCNLGPVNSMEAIQKTSDISMEANKKAYSGECQKIYSFFFGTL